MIFNYDVITIHIIFLTPLLLNATQFNDNFLL